ncbi:MAG: Sec-independent protein translocase protein TatB [Burkholderiales bacterium]|nr:Sec-independent protein translocase protein TatB [Burkholderiales bacterium]
MFELSFGKMMIIALVALIVLGPEKLPRVARTIGHLLGRARSYANQVKADIDREMQMEELRKLQQQAQDAARSFETSVNDAARSVEAEATKVEQSVNTALAAAEAEALAAAESGLPPPVAPSEIGTAPLAHATLDHEAAALDLSIAEQASAATAPRTEEAPATPPAPANAAAGKPA